MEDAVPYKEFIREMTLRIERLMREFGREMSAMRKDMRSMNADINDLRAESRAQTEALLHILDRLDGGQAPAG